MTYCVGILVRDGLVMIGDTRTNAGVDNISTFRKMHLFEKPGERVIVLMTAGNLAITQAVVSVVTEGENGPDDADAETLLTVPSMVAAAGLERLRAFLNEHFWSDAPDDLLNVLAVADRADGTVQANEALRAVGAGTRISVLGI